MMLILTRHYGQNRMPRSGLKVGNDWLWFTEVDGETVTVEIVTVTPNGIQFVDTDVLHLNQDKELLDGVNVVIHKITPTIIKVGIGNINGIKVLRDEVEHIPINS